MMNRSVPVMLNRFAVVSLILGCAVPLNAGTGAPQVHSDSQAMQWDDAFVDRSGARPLHFVASYHDARGNHRLEEWRTGLTHLRRRTDDRIDLHADAVNAPRPGEAADLVWQIVDLQKHIDNRIGSQAMLHAGLFYSFYSMAHVVSRPAGRFKVAAVEGLAPLRLAGYSCRWYEIAPEAQPGTRVCWSPELGVPIETQGQRPDRSWVSDFHLETVDRVPFSNAIFKVNLAGLQVRNLDQMEDVD